MRRKKHCLPQPPLTREQELLQDFQQGEAAELREEPEAVDKQIRNERRTWARIAEDAGIAE